jgi:splicing factor 3B subunit 3
MLFAARGRDLLFEFSGMDSMFLKLQFQSYLPILLQFGPLKTHPQVCFLDLDEFDKFIVVSFANATLVLSIGETVEEVTDTGLLVSSPTINVSLLGEDDIVQVYMYGIRHVRQDKRVSEWRVPVGTTNLHAACNERQVAVALSNSELVYFELDNMGNLNEFEDHKTMTSSVTCLAFSPVFKGRQRASFMAVGCADNTVRVMSLDPSNCMEPLGMQALSSSPTSLLFTEMIDATTGLATLYLHIGLENGVLLRTTIDDTSGAISDSRLRFLGAKSVKLFPLTISGSAGLLALSTKPWISYSHQSRTKLVPLK